MSARNLSRWLLIAGIALFLVAIIWPYILPASTLYDDSQATELSNAAESLHDTMHAHGHGHDHDHFGGVHDGDDNPEVTAAAKRYRDAQARLDSAQFWTSSVPVYLRWSGIAIAVVGIATFLTKRQA